MLKITDKYMNNYYTKFYKQELKNELQLNKTYNREKKTLLKKALFNYCNKMSIITDFNEGNFSHTELENYTKGIRLIIEKENYSVKEYIYATRNKMMLNFNTPSTSSYKNIKTIEEIIEEFEARCGKAIEHIKPPA